VCIKGPEAAGGSFFVQQQELVSDNQPIKKMPKRTVQVKKSDLERLRPMSDHEYTNGLAELEARLQTEINDIVRRYDNSTGAEKTRADIEFMQCGPRFMLALNTFKRRIADEALRRRYEQMKIAADAFGRGSSKHIPATFTMVVD